MKLVVVIMSMLVLSIGSCAGKKADEKAAAACAVKDKSNPASEDPKVCETCCNKAGYTGYMWMSNVCTCQ
jgi:hypothetical protein